MVVATEDVIHATHASHATHATTAHASHQVLQLGKDFLIWVRVSFGLAALVGSFKHAMISGCCIAAIN